MAKLRSNPGPVSDVTKVVCPDVEPASTSELDAVVEAIASVARERVALMEQLRGALQERDDARALGLARELVGLPKDGAENEKGH